MEIQDFRGVIVKATDLLQVYPTDIRLLASHAVASEGLSAHKEAEAIWDKLQEIFPSNDEGKTVMLAGKMRAILWQADFERFLATAEAYCAMAIPNTSKVAELDQLACLPLYGQVPEEKHHAALGLAEFCVRKALELAPNRVTLKGTLGGCLVERGHFDEAEPLLMECYQNGSTFDRAICSLFLGLIAEHRHEWRTALRFARESTVLVTPPLLARRGGELRERLAKRKESLKT